MDPLRSTRRRCDGEFGGTVFNAMPDAMRFVVWMVSSRNGGCPLPRRTHWPRRGGTLRRFRCGQKFKLMHLLGYHRNPHATPWPFSSLAVGGFSFPLAVGGRPRETPGVRGPGVEQLKRDRQTLETVSTTALLIICSWTKKKSASSSGVSLLLGTLPLALQTTTREMRCLSFATWS